MPQKFTFQNPNGPEFVPVLGKIVSPGDVVEFPDDYVIDPSDKWVPVTGAAPAAPVADDGGNSAGA